MLTASFLMSFFICIVAGITYLLSKKNGRDIRVVWYLSSLTVMITFGVAWIAISTGAIKEGQFVGEYGAFLNSVIEFMLDLEKDFLVFTGVASFIMVPQFACYILSGLSGNAKSPMLMSASFSFLFWGIIKSLVVCASVLVSLGGLCLLGYLSESGHNSWLFVVTGLYSLVLAFGIIFLYREGEQLARYVGKHVPFLKAVHIWFTRKEKASTSEEETDEVDLLELSLSLLSVSSEIQQAARKYKVWKSPSTERSPT